MKLSNLLEVEYGVHDLLTQHMDQIKLDSGPRTYRMLQTQLALGKDAWVENWLKVNGYVEDPNDAPPNDKALPFEEQIKNVIKKEVEECWKSYKQVGMKKKGNKMVPNCVPRNEEIETPGERNAKVVADKAKQIVKKTGKELGNLAKDIYDTPTIKRLRAYINSELEKLIDKYGVDYPGKQTKIPFPKDEMDENLRNWFKKEKWKRIDTQGNIAGDCGTMPKGKKTQRCLPQAKAQSLTKKQRAATSRKKTRSKKQFVKNTKAAKVKK